MTTGNLTEHFQEFTQGEHVEIAVHMTICVLI